VATCSRCLCSFGSSQAVAQHQRDTSHTSYCTHCSRSFKTHQGLSEHWRVTHSFSCQQCGRKCRPAESLRGNGKEAAERANPVAPGLTGKVQRKRWWSNKAFVLVPEQLWSKRLLPEDLRHCRVDFGTKPRIDLQILVSSRLIKREMHSQNQ